MNAKYFACTPFAASLIALVGIASTAAAIDMPKRKPGLWEISVSAQGMPSMGPMQQCIDRNTDNLMQQEAERMGFDSQTARALVQQAASGAAALVEANPETPLSTLREQVTSKGGTTAEALRVFNEQQLPATVAKAMQAAVSRAQEMEKSF